MSALAEPKAFNTAAFPPTLLPEPVATLAATTKRYRHNITALDQLSLTLHAGEIVALLGPNGAGKSTAVKLMMGLTAPTAGAVRIFGQDPRFAANRLRTGVMLQVGRAPETLKVREHLELFRGYYPHHCLSPNSSASPASRALKTASSASSPAVKSSAFCSPSRWRATPTSSSSTNPP